MWAVVGPPEAGREQRGSLRGSDTEGTLSVGSKSGGGILEGTGAW